MLAIFFNFILILRRSYLSVISFSPLIRLIVLVKLDVHEIRGYRGFRSNGSVAQSSILRYDNIAPKA